MTTITLEAIKAEQSRLAELIAKFESTAKPRVISIDEAEISLAEGEVYAGLILNDDGTPSHHLILLPGETEGTWKNAKAWAEKAGGDLPTRREQSLLFANAKTHCQERHYWSSEVYADNGSGAWIQFFRFGSQDWDLQVNTYCARAVRRLSA